MCEVREAGATGQGHGLVGADLERRKGLGWGEDAVRGGRSAIREVGLAPSKGAARSGGPLCSLLSFQMRYQFSGAISLLIPVQCFSSFLDHNPQ